MKKIVFSLLCALTTLSGGFINPALAADNSTTLTFATEATYPPFESIDSSGQMQGFEVDLIHAICTQIKAQCQLVNQPFESLIPSLKLGKFDAIFGALVINASKKQEVDFTQPFYKSTISVAANQSDNFPINTTGLKGKTIGVQGGTNFQYYLEGTYKDLIAAQQLTIKTYASQQEAFLDLKSKRVDAVVGDTPAVLYWLKQPENQAYHILGTPIESIEYIGEGYGIAVKKGNTALLNQLNQAISALKANGQLNQLVKKYFS